MALNDLSLPAATVAQLAALVDLLRDSLGQDLRGAILHGSAASAGFTPGRSDLDVLVIAAGRLQAAQRRRLGEGLLTLSSHPDPVELSVVAVADLEQWQHPCAHQFHFGEEQRERFQQGRFGPATDRDVDLAAHVTVARARGVALVDGYPPRRLPEVPRQHYLAAVLSDLNWAGRRSGMADYLLANACRTRAFLRTGRVLSKTEGLEWCLAAGVDATDLVREVKAELWVELFG